MRKSFKKNVSAYSLAEVAISLLILGILAGTFFDVKLIKTEVENIKNINDQFNQIELAIDTFVAKNGYLPCPAARTDAVATADFGKSTNCSTAAPSGTIETGSGVDIVRIGVLPVRSLDLPDSMMFDPWNNRITFAVIKNLAQNKPTYEAYTTASTNVIRINDANGNKINRDNLSTQENLVSWVIVSHGKDGKGSYNYNGSLKACSSTLDQENCDDDNTFIDTPYNPSSTNAFDDYVLWKTKNQQTYDKQTFIVPTAGSSGQCEVMFDPTTFTPKDISGLRLWLDASDFTTLFEDENCTDTTDGYADRVRCWKDKSGNGYIANNSSGGDSPNWYNEGGKGHVCFNYQFLRIVGNPNGAVFPNGSTLSQMEFIMVTDLQGTSGGRTLSYALGNGIRLWMPDGSGNLNWQFNTNVAGNLIPFNNSIGHENKYIMNCYAYTSPTGNELKCWNNDQNILSSTTTGPEVTVGTQNFFIGCESGSKSFCQIFHLYELLIYDRKLTDEERQKIKGYLYKRWWS